MNVLGSIGDQPYCNNQQSIFTSLEKIVHHDLNISNYCVHCSVLEFKTFIVNFCISTSYFKFLNIDLFWKLVLQIHFTNLFPSNVFPFFFQTFFTNFYLKLFIPNYFSIFYKFFLKKLFQNFCFTPF